MDDTASYPPIEPSNFDLIVIGTGLPESILSAAASAAGKTVLHLDPNPYYGTHYSSLSLTDLTSFLQSQSQSQTLTPNPENDDSTPLLTRPVYSAVEIAAHSSEPIDNSKKFNLDLSGPRVFFCGDAMIDLILRTGISQYMEFKSIDASFVSDAEGNLGSVPDSRSAIFKDRSLSFPEKNQLMKFFKLVQGHFGKEGGGGEEDRISEEDLAGPFVEFLSKMGLSKKLKSLILYAIVLADYDQDNLDVCKDVIDTKTGMNRLALYHSSIGRFSNANGAMIYPIYGQGELPQAFCRRSAVKGCIHVLRMPIVSVLMDKDSGIYKGVKLVSGQELFSTQLILAPSFTIASQLAPSAAQVSNIHHDVGLGAAKEKIFRGICITKNSLKSEVANCLVFFPPRSLYPEQITSVRVLQLSSNLAVSPSGMFVTYFSAMCDNAEEGKKLLDAAINALFSVCSPRNSENSDNDNLSPADTKPSLLWSALYMQDTTVFRDMLGSIHYTAMPDEHLHYIDLLIATEKLFKEIYPDEEFLAPTNSTDEHLEDGSSELD